MRVDLPVHVMLRCRVVAEVRQAAQGVAPFVLQGHSPHGVDLWQRDGSWNEDKTPSRFDIVAVYDADGKPHALSDQFSRK